jgi:ribonuclease VapC
MTPKYVLDASVLLASILGEPGRERVLELEETAFVSAVNMAETRSKLSDKGLSADDIELSLDALDKIVVDFGDGDAIGVATLRKSTRTAGLSLGDRACLALARRLGATALTADRNWSSVDMPIKIEVIR